MHINLTFLHNTSHNKITDWFWTLLVQTAATELLVAKETDAKMGLKFNVNYLLYLNAFIYLFTNTYSLSVVGTGNWMDVSGSKRLTNTNPAVGFVVPA